MVTIPQLAEIKQRREELKITQRELAKLCDIKPSSLNMIEKGNSKPSYDVFVKIFRVLAEQAEKSADILKTASKICTKNLIKVSSNYTLDETIKIMRQKNFSQIPVIDSTGCKGLITEHSILKFQLENGKETRAKVADAMESPPPIIDWNQPITPRILDLLYDANCLLVSQDGKIKGIIAKIDAIKGTKR